MTTPPMNPWEVAALDYQFPEDDSTETGSSTSTRRRYLQDPLIYPNLYAPSGLDAMAIIVRVLDRPNPVVTLGAVDHGCAFLICDLAGPDTPIIYASDSFTKLTGYSPSEVLGRNCRFLQAPGGRVTRSSPRKHITKDTLKKLRHAVERRDEIQIHVVNFKKSGAKFVNLLSIIPVRVGNDEYAVGFLADRDDV